MVDYEAASITSGGNQPPAHYSENLQRKRGLSGIPPSTCMALNLSKRDTDTKSSTR